VMSALMVAQENNKGYLSEELILLPERKLWR